jgi:hypothetical protein
MQTTYFHQGSSRISSIGNAKDISTTRRSSLHLFAICVL